jgi:hypothetical protein
VDELLGMLGAIVVFALVMRNSGSCLFSFIAGVAAFAAVTLLVASIGAGGIVVGIVGVMALWWLFSHI